MPGLPEEEHVVLRHLDGSVWAASRVGCEVTLQLESSTRRPFRRSRAFESPGAASSYLGSGTQRMRNVAFSEAPVAALHQGSIHLLGIEASDARGRLGTWSSLAARTPVALLHPPGRVWPPAPGPLVDFVGLPFPASLEGGDVEVRSTDEFSAENRVGEIGWAVGRGTVFQIALPTGVVLAVCSEARYCELQGVAEAVVQVVRLDEQLRLSEAAR